MKARWRSFSSRKAEDQALFGPPLPPSPFRHIALKCDEGTQREARRRLEEAGYSEPDVFVLEHGYCTSLYATDPNGMIELTVDRRGRENSAGQRRANAHAELERWLAGDYTSNNLCR